jgi:hypothetical protein
MSERTTSDVLVNTTSPAPEQATQQQVPEQNVAPPAERPAPEQAVPQQAEQAAAEAARTEEQARDAAEKTRQAAVRAYRQGERAYAKGLLLAGELAGRYIGQRLALGDKREACVQALEGELAKYSSTAVDVSRLVRTWEAYRLLALEQELAGEGTKKGPADGVPYGQYRDHWARLVERAPGTRAESYVLLPGLEKACRSMFRRAVRDELSTTAAGECVARLVRAHVARRDRAEKARLAKATAEAKAREEQAARAAAELRAAEAAKREAEQRAKQANDAAATEAAEQAAAELRAKQEAAVKAQAAAEAAAREKARAAKAAAEEAKRLERAAEKAARKQQAQQAKDKPATVTPPQGEHPPAKQGTVTGNLLTIARAGTARDVASMVLELVQGCDTPDDVLELVLKGLKAGKALSAKGKRACDAALLVLTRQDKPAPAAPAASSPVEAAAALANSNGHVAAVA